jgi:hypothetical protein
LDPLDQIDPKFEEQKNCEYLIELLNKKFNNSKCAKPYYFNSDMTALLEQMMNKEIFSKLNKEPNFVEVLDISLQVKTIITQILQQWQGPVQERSFM